MEDDQRLKVKGVRWEFLEMRLPFGLKIRNITVLYIYFLLNLVVTETSITKDE